MKTLEARRDRAIQAWNELRDSARPLIYVGAGSCGLAAGAGEVIKAITDYLAEKQIGADILRVGCIGPCYLEPLVDIQMPGSPRISYANITPGLVRELFDSFFDKGEVYQTHLVGHFGENGFERAPRFFDHPMLARQLRVVLRNCGIIDPENLDHYLARDGYRGFEKCLSMSWHEVLEIIKASGLRGRGGAGFPTWRKWLVCRETESDARYLICNADEGDPGAFMNRSLIEGDPHAVLEGMLIAAYTIGASKGYVYIRAEYPLAIERLRSAISRMRELGLLGAKILGSDFDFDISIKEGAGAFVCGEETALIASIEGRRGMPRTRPPFPAVEGLWGRPTIINNTETLGTLPNILRNGAAWYCQFGTQGNQGTKTFSLVGKVRRTGLIEVPLGTSLRKIIFDIGDGCAKPFKAVQTGGPSGGCLSSQFVDTPADYESLAAAGTIMGSGGLIVLDEDTCVVDIARYFLDFTQRESCGQCSPCRIGTRHMVETLERITRGEGELEDLAQLATLAETVRKGSLCGLGQTAPNPLLTTLRYFRREFERHIVDKRCDAFVCRDLVGAPCQSACPLGTEAWRYVALIGRGEYDAAYHVIREANPLPSICSRVCNHPCEERCRAGTTGGDPVAIRALKRFVTDRIDPMTFKPERRVTAPPGAPPVAVIGSGPAGLAAAHYLSLAGYKVTVFESDPAPGGMMFSAIPSYRLPREIMKREIASLIDENVTLRCNTTLGRDVTLDTLLGEGYGAIFLALGAHKSLRLGLDGEDSAGVIPSITFLKAFNQRGEQLAKGRVGVVGGGNSAVDAARTALRQPGVESVTIFYRRTAKEMPAFAEEVEAAQQEGVRLAALTAPVRILTQNGTLTGIRCIANRLGDFDASGRRRPVPIPGSEFDVLLETLIVAISEGSDTDCVSVAGANRVEVTTAGTVKVDPGTLFTNRPGVFAGGDVVTGPNTVVDAIAAGKKAAVMIDRHLRGMALAQPEAPRRPQAYVEPLVPEPQSSEPSSRVELPRLATHARLAGFAAVEMVFSVEEAATEARRCLRCDLAFTQPLADVAVSAGKREGSR